MLLIGHAERVQDKEKTTTAVVTLADLILVRIAALCSPLRPPPLPRQTLIAVAGKTDPKDVHYTRLTKS